MVHELSHLLVPILLKMVVRLQLLPGGKLCPSTCCSFGPVQAYYLDMMQRCGTFDASMDLRQLQTS